MTMMLLCCICLHIWTCIRGNPVYHIYCLIYNVHVLSAYISDITPEGSRMFIWSVNWDHRARQHDAHLLCLQFMRNKTQCTLRKWTFVVPQGERWTHAEVMTLHTHALTTSIITKIIIDALLNWIEMSYVNACTSGWSASLCSRLSASHTQAFYTGLLQGSFIYLCPLAQQPPEKTKTKDILLWKVLKREFPMNSVVI